MAPNKLSKRIIQDIDKLVELFKDNYGRYERCAGQVYDLLGKHELLTGHVHSVKYRVKDPEHLRDKLMRKALEAKRSKMAFEIDSTNLFTQIEDLAGVRLLHLHTHQIGIINSALLQVFDEESYDVVEGPIANTWDVEYEKFFNGLSISTKSRDSLYTSVHYVIEASNKYHTRCELQVRTLMEEVWGEVSHRIDYPEKIESIACQEQIKVLARVTSSCTRLVDSIFRTKEDYLSNLS